MDLIEPELTFPPEVADFVKREYAAASIILEYGSGGSTLVAARLGGKKVFSVESDPVWAENMRETLRRVAPNAEAHIHYADIGPTREWGLPKHYSRLHALSYLRYPRSVWRRPDFLEPDIVLIDGRFRVGCFWTVAARIKHPTRVLFDDYKSREPYHCIEKFISPVEMIGRMAVFDLEPTVRRPPLGLWRLRHELAP